MIYDLEDRRLITNGDYWIADNATARCSIPTPGCR